MLFRLAYLEPGFCYFMPLHIDPFQHIKGSDGKIDLTSVQLNSIRSGTVAVDLS